MYWIYLIIFIVAVFVPEIVSRGVSGLSQMAVQELALLFLGLINFGIFLIFEKRMLRLKQEKIIASRDVNRLTKDLTNSYSYIGETNRKLEILKSIMLSLPPCEKMTADKERETLHLIVQSAHILTKSSKIILRINKEQVGIIKEIKSDADLVWTWKLDREKFWAEQGCFIENEDCFMFVSQKYPGGIKSSLIIMKDVAHRTIDDVDFMKTLTFYALIVFFYCENAKKIGHKAN